MEVDPERGKRIKALREDAGYTQKQLADNVGARHYQLVQKWERGDPISYPNLLALARVLKADVETILGEEPDETAELSVDDRIGRVEGALLSLVRNEVDDVRTRIAGLSRDFTGFSAWARNAFTEVTTGLGELRAASEGQTVAVEGLSDQVQALRSELRELRGSVEAAAAPAKTARPRSKRPAEDAR